MTSVDIDIGIIQLASAFIMLAYCITILLLWWKKKGAASQMYVYVVLLLSACLLNSGMGLYVRILGNINSVAYHNFLDSCIWQWRYLPFNIVLVFLIVSIKLKIKKNK